MTDTTQVWEQLAAIRVVPVVEIDRPDDAVALARTLLDAGLPLMEITLRTPAALEAIEQVSTACPELLVGAGTLLDVAAVRSATAAGARFGVAPGLHPASVTAAGEIGLPFIPGVLTPSDVLHAMEFGLRHLKFFPAGAFGGPRTLAALAGPFAAAGVRFLPTGGITADDAPAYLDVPSVFAVGGSWIAPRQSVVEGRWDQIEARARAAVALAGAGVVAEGTSA